jgi:hypothetical protein
LHVTEFTTKLNAPFCNRIAFFADAFCHEVNLLEAEHSWQRNIGHMGFGQAVGFFTGSAVEMDVQIVVASGLTLVGTERKFCRTGAVVDLVDYAFFLECFVGAVKGDPVGMVHACLDVVKANGMGLFFQILEYEQAHCSGPDTFPFQYAFKVGFQKA